MEDEIATILMGDNYFDNVRQIQALIEQQVLIGQKDILLGLAGWDMTEEDLETILHEKIAELDRQIKAQLTEGKEK